MRVVVVGGGAVGLVSAFELARAGADVTVLERDRCGRACTWGNTGWICPVLAAPLPAPGVMGAALRGMLRRDSPIVIRPVVGPAFLRWSWEFWRACTATRNRAGLLATVTLGVRSVELFHELRENGVEFELSDAGMLVVARSAAGLEEYATLLRSACDAGYPGEVELVDGDAARTLDRAVGGEVVGGVYAPEERYVRPEGLVAGLVDALRRGGADVREETPVTRLERRGAWHVETPGRSFEADAVVVAAGVWSGRLLEPFVRIRLEAAKGYSVTARGRGTAPRLMLFFAEAKVGASAWADEVRVAGVFDLTGIDASLRPRRLETLTRAARAYLHDWTPIEVTQEWAGLRPYPPDGLPVLGAVPGHDGLHVATGHGRKGITLAPVTGRAIASLVLEGRVPDEIRPFAVERFTRRAAA